MAEKKRGRDTFGNVRYDSSGKVLTRCSSCNIYRKREDFPSSLFSVCKLCINESKKFKDEKHRRLEDESVNIYDYVSIGKREQFERALWRGIKSAALSKDKTHTGKTGRPSTSKARQRALANIINHRSKTIPKKYRELIIQLIADDTLTPAQTMWLAFKPGVLQDNILRLCAVDTAKEIVLSSDLQELCDVSYFYDDAEYIALFPDSAASCYKAQKDLRLRVADVAKKLTKLGKVPNSAWDAYDALLCAIHPGSRKAAESTAYHYIQIQTRVWGWHIEKALRKLIQVYTNRIERNCGIASSSDKAYLIKQSRQLMALQARDEEKLASYEEKEKAERSIAKSYWMSCETIYPADRYLAMIGEDEVQAVLLVFHNPSNQLEVGRKIKVLKEDLVPGPKGYYELPKEDLEAQGVKLI